MKTVIVGGVAGGMTAATRLRRVSSDMEIVVLERDRDISFSNCSLTWHLDGYIEDYHHLILDTPDGQSKKYNMDVRNFSEVLSVDTKNKKLLVKNLKTNEEYEETYDNLILSPGADPINPKFDGINNIEFYSIRNPYDVEIIRKRILKKDVNKIAVIGGGYIGIEATEHLLNEGLKVSLIAGDRVLAKAIDKEFSAIIHNKLLEKGVDLHLDVLAEDFTDKGVLLSSGEIVEADIVISAIGVRPNTDFIKGSDIKMDDRGYIEVGEYFQTSADDVYAIGDAVKVQRRGVNEKTPVQLAGPALRSARTVADFICGKKDPKLKFVAANSVPVFDLNVASVGYTEDVLKNSSFKGSYDSLYLVVADRVGHMKNMQRIFFKIIFETPSGRLLGAQAISRGYSVRAIDVLSAMLQFDATHEDLLSYEPSYSPPYGNARDVINICGMAMDNVLRKEVKQLLVSKLEDLPEDALIVDVRKEELFNKSHIKGSINIPISKLRNSSEKLIGKKVYIIGNTGTDGYNAVRIVQSYSDDMDVTHLTGGMMLLDYIDKDNIFRNNKSIIEKERP